MQIQRAAFDALPTTAQNETSSAHHQRLPIVAAGVRHGSFGARQWLLANDKAELFLQVATPFRACDSVPWRNSRPHLLTLVRTSGRRGDGLCRADVGILNLRGVEDEFVFENDVQG